MRCFKLKDFEKILENNGYKLDRINGGHFIYKNSQGVHISLPKTLNPTISSRLIKQFKLNTL